MYPRIDLHTHSRCSDGTQSVDELVADAAAADLEVLALTDHDTTAGWEEARQAAHRYGVSVVPGIEVTAQRGKLSIHLLAYLPDGSEDTELSQMLHAARTARDERARIMTERIAEDHPITWDDVLAQVADDKTVVGRPHIADALVARGIVPDRSAAFADLLSSRSPYYVPHAAPTPVQAVRAVGEAGGVPVAAHPAADLRGGHWDDALFADMIAAGLAGIEVDHREHTHAERDRLRALAEHHGLIITGGSDYHGAGKPNRLGENLTAPDHLRALIERARRGTEVFSP